MIILGSVIYNAIMLDPKKIETRRKGYTQTELAKKAGMSVQQWNNVESGRKPNPTISTVERMARAMKCRVDDLLSKDD